MSAEQGDNIARQCEEVELRVEEPRVEETRDAEPLNVLLPDVVLPVEVPHDIGAAEEGSRPDFTPDEVAIDVGPPHEDLRREAQIEDRTEQLEEEDQGPIDITTDPVKIDEIDLPVAVEVAQNQQIVVVETATTPGEKHNKGRPRHPFKDLYFEQQVRKTSPMQRFFGLVSMSLVERVKGNFCLKQRPRNNIAPTALSPHRKHNMETCRFRTYLKCM